MSEARARDFEGESGQAEATDSTRNIYQAGMVMIAAAGAGALGLAASQAAQPFVLTVLAVLAAIGVFFLFAWAAGYIRFAASAADPALIRGWLDAIPDGILVTDATGRMIAANRGFRKLVSGTAAVSLESLLAGRIGSTEALFRLTRAAERGATHAEEIALALGAEGQERSLRITVRPFESTTGAQTRDLRVWQVRDVTAERTHQADLVASVESRLQHFANLPVGLMSIRSDGHVTFLNERLSAWLGHPADMRGREPMLAELVADGGAHLIETVQATGEGAPQRLELDLITEAGRRWPATVLVSRQESGVTVAVLERAQDTRAGRAARTSEQRFSRFFQSAPFGIAVIDADGVIANANTSFARLLLDGGAQKGANIEELLGRTASSVRRQIEAALEAARDGKANILPFDIVLGAKGRGRELVRRVYVSALTRSGANQESAIVYVHDVTEAKALEHRVAQAQKMEAVGTLAGGIAHDFNNVLTAIIGFSDLLLQMHKPGNPSYAHILSVKSSANRAAGLVRQLLAFSRRQTLQPKILQLGDVLTDWSMLLNRLLGEKIELKIITGRDLWFVKADPTELERTIINLAVNARDAMLPKGGKLFIRTRNVTERDCQKLEGQGIKRGEYVLIEVEDTGTGMTPEILAKIFEPFFTTKAVGKGTGLGLASVTGFVQQTGGYIVPESTPGEGTTFRIYLPRHHLEADEEVEPVLAAKKPRTGDLTGTGRLLVVEDEDAVRRFVVTALKSKGYEVHQASNGVEALDVMESIGDKIDLVISDVIMPEMDGPTLLSELRKKHPELRFILASGYPDDAFKNNLDPDAEFTFLPKPYSLAQLAALVKDRLGR